MPHLFAYGFRPNFLAAGLAAAVLVPLWIAGLTGSVELTVRWPGSLWHGHELLFGFVAAAIGGFLLTAVPSWTGQRGFAGRPLVALASLWLLGRLAPFAPADVPDVVVALVDLAYLPAVGALVAPLLFRTRNRNRVLLLVIAALTACNAAFHWSVARGEFASASLALLATVNFAVVLITIIAGRIVPAFTSSGLRASPSPVRPSVPWLERVVVGATVLVAAVDLVAAGTAVAGVVAAIAGIAHAVRAGRWAPLRTGSVPLVWVLHLGYAWIPVGLLLKAAALLGGVPFAAFWLHALTAGALATMIVAVMTRASLGHTGRELRAAPATVASYLLLTAAAIVRVFGPATGADYRAVLALAAMLWTAAFAAYLLVYAPILASPRADGRAG
jgi:uncharacterized protein involved in response to NO